MRRLAGKPYEVRSQDLTQEFLLDAPWRGADALIYAVSTRGGDVEAYRMAYLEGFLNSLAAAKPRRSLFVSSTSVYAQRDGEWVTEDSPSDPPRDTGRILRDAEGVALASGGYVARLAGLYGPKRSVLLKRYLAKEAALDGEGSRWINQIHRDDAARALFHLYAHRCAPGIYNVADDQPATQRDVYQWIADFLGGALPAPAQGDVVRRRGASNKRVSNAKLKAAGWTPLFPAYRVALPDLVRAEE
ncbi:hypothetical protein TSACC_3576 [Terrimicrobium sacchariphilum]|uniref:Nucleoside-diphosphate-sugar epimerase n=1 Tax=Terrimicrobium sacchariphilum TaxID=690879 RepID=A0A146GD66_TERSA|nr:hypothetical protein TSACC_3576 [Terrimicrobium sacchariphilum]